VAKLTAELSKLLTDTAEQVPLSSSFFVMSAVRLLCTAGCMCIDITYS